MTIEEPYAENSMRGILKKKDARLFSRLEENWEKAEKTLLDYITEDDYTTHGVGHCKNIESKLEEVIPNKVKENLNPVEIFILLNSVLYHDIGRASKKFPNEPIEKRMAEHHIRSRDFIKANYKDLGLEQSIALRVADVCFGHGVDEIDQFDNDDYIEGYGKVDIRFLVALLRIGDILDYAQSRAPLLTAKMKWISGKSYYYWIRHNLIESIRPKYDKKEIIITGLPRGEWGKTKLYEIRNWMQSELEKLKNVFIENNMRYDSFTLKIKKDLLETYRPGRKGKNPFQMLLPYDEKTRDIYFGRKKEIDEFIGKIFSNRINILLGESGVGKTSFIKAGIVEVLREMEFTPIYFDDYYNIINNLVNEIQSKTSLHLEENEDIIDLIKKACSERYRLVLILDQFEKNFYKHAVNGEIFDFLTKIVKDEDIEIKIILSLRNDFADDLWGFSEENNLMLLKDHFRTRIYKIGREAGANIIGKAVKKAELKFDDDLIKRIVDDLILIHRKESIFFPDLQIVCSTLCDHLIESGSGKVLEKMYGELGGAKGIISNYFKEKMWKGFIKSEVPIAREIINSLVTIEGIRLQLTAKEISEMIGISEVKVEDILLQLINKRLARRMIFEEKKKPRYELVHDFLGRSVAENLTDEEKQEKEMRDLLTSSVKDWKKHGILLGEDKLKILIEYDKISSIDDETLELFVNSSYSFKSIQEKLTEIFGNRLINPIIEFISSNIEFPWEMKRWVREIGNPIFSPLKKEVERIDDLRYKLNLIYALGIAEQSSLNYEKKSGIVLDYLIDVLENDKSINKSEYTDAKIDYVEKLSWIYKYQDYYIYYSGEEEESFGNHPEKDRLKAQNEGIKILMSLYQKNPSNEIKKMIVNLLLEFGQKGIDSIVNLGGKILPDIDIESYYWWKDDWTKAILALREKLGKKVTIHLLSESKGKPLSETLIYILGEIGDDLALEALVKELRNSYSAYSQKYSVRSVVKILGEKSNPILIDILEKTPYAIVRKEIVEAFSKIGDETAIPHLQKIIKNDTAYVVGSAQEALRIIQSKQKDKH